MVFVSVENRSQRWRITEAAIMTTYHATSRAVMTVVTTASHFFLSRIIPKTPSTKAMGGEKIMANPARGASRLPHPGLQSLKNRMTAGTTASNVAEILPKRIVLSLKSITSLSA